MTTVPSIHGGRNSWVLQSPIDAEGKTWEDIKAIKLSLKGAHGHFIPLIRKTIGNGKHLLDIGSGDCSMTCAIVENTENRAVALDLVDEPKHNCNARKIIDLAGLTHAIKFYPGMNATFPLPFEDGSFDSSTALAVLEHTWCPGHQNIIENMIRVTKKTCIFIIPILNNRWRVSPYVEGAGHINQFDEYRIRRCFGRHHYFFEIYRNKVGLPCWLIIMNLEVEQETDDGAVKWI